MTEFADILCQVISEVRLACLLHHVIARTAAEDDQEDRGDIMEPLDVLKSCIFGEEAIQDLEDVSLPFPAK